MPNRVVPASKPPTTREIKLERPLPGLGSTLRTSEWVRDGTGTFRIESIDDDGYVTASFDWSYELAERWRIVGTRRDERGEDVRAVLEYTHCGVSSDELSRDARFEEIYRMLVLGGHEGIEAPGWLDQLTAGGSKLKLITMSCTSCSLGDFVCQC